MEIEYDSLDNEKYKKNSITINENTNNKEIKYNSKLLLSDGIFGSKNQGKYDFFNKDLSSTTKNGFLLPNCKIISSLFSKENITKSLNQSIKSKKNSNENYLNKNYINNGNYLNINTNLYDNNMKENHNSNTFLMNYRIYNIKESSLFHIRIFGKYIKYFPIFTNLTDFEKLICYNPLIENNPNFEIISQNYPHENFYIKNYDLSVEKIDNLKEKYIKHLYTKKNIIYAEEIFKYLFEEIKITLSCINVQIPYDEILMNCSNLIDNINTIIEDILKENNDKENIHLNINKQVESQKSSENKNYNETDKFEIINNFEIKNNLNEDNYCIFNNSKIKKNFILSDINSKCIEINFLDYNKNNNLDEKIKNNQINNKDNENNNIKNDLSEQDDDIKEKNIIMNEEKNKKESKEIYSCPYCSRTFNSHCGLGGHMSKRHPKNQNK